MQPQCDVCTRMKVSRKSLVWGVSVYTPVGYSGSPSTANETNCNKNQLNFFYELTSNSIRMRTTMKILISLLTFFRRPLPLLSVFLCSSMSALISSSSWLGVSRRAASADCVGGWYIALEQCSSLCEGAVVNSLEHVHIGEKVLGRVQVECGIEEVNNGEKQEKDKHEETDNERSNTHRGWHEDGMSAALHRHIGWLVLSHAVWYAWNELCTSAWEKWRVRCVCLETAPQICGHAVFPCCHHLFLRLVIFPQLWFRPLLVVTHFVDWRLLHLQLPLVLLC